MHLSGRAAKSHAMFECSYIKTSVYLRIEVYLGFLCFVWRPNKGKSTIGWGGGVNSSLSIWRAGLLPAKAGSRLVLNLDLVEPGGHAEGGSAAEANRGVGWWWWGGVSPVTGEPGQ